MNIRKEREGIVVRPDRRLSDEQIRLMNRVLFKQDIFTQNNVEAMIGGSASFG